MSPSTNRMRPFESVIPLEEALRILESTGAPIERTEEIDLASVNGRVIARDVIASSDVPPFSRAGMDGYAVKAGDTAGASAGHPRSVKRIATLFTGQVSTKSVQAGECIEISTGAPMPDGADAVVMVEETSSDNDAIQIFIEVQPQQNVGKQGADIRTGHSVVRAGDVLNSARVGALAAVGTSSLMVFDRPRVAILSTGNEVVQPGRPLKPGEIYDINRYTIAAVVSENGGVAVPYPPAPDSLPDLVAALDRAVAASDLVVFSGGSSVGERDLIRDAISTRGTLLFHGIAVKPGKPTGLGLVEGKPVFAMPGYPTSCLSNAHILLTPLLRRIARLGPAVRKTLTLPLSRRVVSTPGRHHFYTVRIAGGHAEPAFKASGDITSMSQADGYIEIGAEVGAVEAGALVDVTLF